MFLIMAFHGESIHSTLQKQAPTHQTHKPATPQTAQTPKPATHQTPPQTQTSEGQQTHLQTHLPLLRVWTAQTQVTVVPLVVALVRMRTTVPRLTMEQETALTRVAP